MGGCPKLLVGEGGEAVLGYFMAGLELTLKDEAVEVRQSLSA
jgi:hypothetical protein